MGLCFWKGAGCELVVSGAVPTLSGGVLTGVVEIFGGVRAAIGFQCGTPVRGVGCYIKHMPHALPPTQAWMLFGAGAAAAGIALPFAFGPVISDAALTLYLLTWAVTPANICAREHADCIYI